MEKGWCSVGNRRLRLLTFIFVHLDGLLPRSHRGSRGKRHEKDRREEARQHNERGIALARQGKHLDAVGEFRAAIEAFRDGGSAYYNLGLSLNQLGVPDQALDAFRTAARLQPSSAPIRFQLALTLLRQEKLDEAIREFRRAIALDPKSAAAHYNFGLALADQGQLASAVPELREAIRLQPDLAPGHLRLGVALRRLGRLDESQREFRQAIRLAPDDSESHYSLGLALKEQHRTAAALRSSKPLYGSSRITWMRDTTVQIVLQQMGEHEGASRELGQLEDLSQLRSGLSQAKLLTNSSRAHLDKHEPDAAVADARAALKLWQDNPIAYYLIGVAAEQKGDTAQSQQDLEKALALQPDYSPALNSLALILWKKGEKDQAIDDSG